MYKCHDITLFNLQNKRPQDKKGQKVEKDEKDKKDKKNRRDKKDKKNYYRNKIKPMVRKNSGFKASVYYHIIYWYY